MACLSLRKSKQILVHAHSCYKKKGYKLSSTDNQAFLQQLQELDQKILEKNKKESSMLATNLQKETKHHFPKTLLNQFSELVVALAFALVVATLVRTLWFELYEIPTGSMRPTFEEQDHIIASKTTFGINIPFITKHFIFDKALVKRGDIVTFSVEDMDVQDPDTVYFYLFPGKRLLVKRCIGKPGDTLYFYGGQIYGIDKEGNDLSELRNTPWMQHIHHVPFISFEGRLKKAPSPREFLITQTQEILAKLTINSLNEIKGQLYNGKNWVSDNPRALLSTHNSIETYSDYWGIKNFAMARLLTSDEASKYAKLPPSDKEITSLYLELFHTPSVSYPSPQLLKDEYGRMRPLLTPQTTLVSLQQKHIDRLMDGLYTARFVVTNNFARRYNPGSNPSSSLDVPLPKVPDGCYEFYFGTAYEVLWGGILKTLPKEHPLYQRDLNTVQTLFNLGIDFNLLYAPHSKNTWFYPQRFAYFNQGNLEVMGSTLFLKNEPELVQFLEKELQKEQTSSNKKPYIAFKDYGAPLKEDGTIHADFIKVFGIKVPENMYFVLGDNYAMSADSRDFGFVPEGNLRGSPAWILWPPGNRLGWPSQPPMHFFTTPTLIIWGIFILIVLIWYSMHRKRMNRSIF
ncbi:MAG: signal peptidase I [Chlamydiales bacterium]|nr:signal peptidase I [Chlamydiales bacterium]